MTSTIQNAAQIPLNQQNSTVPNMSDALRNWFQKMNFTKVVKEVINFQLVESLCPITFRGVIFPLKTRDLELKPEGQRAWTWLALYSDPVLSLNVDDVVFYNGVRTRVMARSNFKLYGYMYYELVQDWERCGNGGNV